MFMDLLSSIINQNILWCFNPTAVVVRTSSVALASARGSTPSVREQQGFLPSVPLQPTRKSIR